MGTAIVIIIILIIIGALRGGKSFGETINKGCGFVITIVVIIIVLIALANL